MFEEYEKEWMCSKCHHYYINKEMAVICCGAEAEPSPLIERRKRRLEEDKGKLKLKKLGKVKC